jgi:hypothetical protein
MIVEFSSVLVFTSQRRTAHRSAPMERVRDTAEIHRVICQEADIPAPFVASETAEP